MAPDEEFGPDGLTTKGIPSTRRGLDRRMVDTLMEQAREAWSKLASDHAELLARIDESGGIEYLSVDVAAVAKEVRDVLEAAETAADGMRERAEAESERRLAAATSEADITKAETARVAGIMRADAESDAFEMRKGAWEESVQMLDEVVATVAAMIEQAEEDVLIIRAEAEREAHRRVSQARREGDDAIRNARFEAERTVTEAKALASELLEDANRDASAAQERTRALEDRRKALLSELEQARNGETGIRVVESPEPRRALQSDRFPDVKARETIDHLAYADELAAEVEALGTSAEEAMPEPEPEPEPELVAEDLEPESESVAEEAEPEPEPVVVEPDPVAEEPEPEPEPEPVAEEPEPDLAASPDSPALVDDLFARLRGSAEPTQETAQELDGAAEVETVATAVAVEDPPPAAASPVVVDGDPIQVRDTLLLPITNMALRAVKQVIVDLQNVALDGLRNDDDWRPEATEVFAAFKPALEGTGPAAAEAGARAAAEITGSSESAPIVDTRSAELSQLMADDFVRQVRAVLAATTDTGPRERSTEVSRVYRGWRVDEAERWVRAIASAAYHDSLAAGLAGAGIGAVRGVPHGTLCTECPARLDETWDPAGETPGSSAMPPAHLDCTCTLTPA